MNTAERNPLFGMKGRKMRTDAPSARAWLDTIGQTAAEMDFIPGQTLSFWIGQAAKGGREDAGLRLEAMAAEIGRGKETVDRFEKGRTRPQELEAMLVGYAKLTELEDPRDIVAQAVRLWYDYGVNPAAEDPQAQADRDVQDVAAAGSSRQSSKPATGRASRAKKR